MSRIVLLSSLLALMVASSLRPTVVRATTDQSVAAPARLRIPAIGLDEPTIPVGVDERGQGVVPKHNVGWFEPSARPGQGDNIVMWGHVLRWKASPQIPAPFERLSKVQVGAEIEIEAGSGKVFRYRVTERAIVRPTPENARYVWPVGTERLTLVTCIGDNVIVAGEVQKSHRLIVIAEPIPEPVPEPAVKVEIEEIYRVIAKDGYIYYMR